VTHRHTDSAAPVDEHGGAGASAPVGVRVVLALLSPRRRWQLWLLLLLALVGAAAELATLGAVVPFLATLSGSGGTQIGVLPLPAALAAATPVQVTLLFVVVALVAAALRLALLRATASFTQGVGHELAVRLVERTLHQPYAYHVARNTSELLAGINKAAAVVSGVLRPLMDGAVASVLALAILAGLVALDWQLSLTAALAFAAAYLGVTRLASAQLVRNSRLIARSQTLRTQALQEGLGGIRDVLLDGSQPLHVGRFRRADDVLRQAAVTNGLWAETPRIGVEALGVAIIAALALAASQRAGGMAAALPSLGALALGAQRLLPLFQRLYSGWALVRGNIGTLEDVERLANAPLPAGTLVQGVPDRLPFRNTLTLQQVGFRYHPTGPWVVRGLDLAIPRGARIGVVGRTGGGKSTLLDLLMGLLEPTEGALFVDGEPITAENRRHWQARIAHVPQAIFLADSSMAANIAFGEEPAAIDRGRVEAAAHRARAHEFIAKLPQGYDTAVGERGVRLSGGQRQRLGIARALYRNADVLVLDEATSALDGDTEASVMEGIEAFGRDMTVLIVAHRLSTLAGCDAVLQLEPGAVRWRDVSIPVAAAS